MPEELLAELRRIAWERAESGAGATPISAANGEAVLEFIRMLESPGPHDHHVLSFIRRHLFDPELRSQRGSRLG